MSVTTLDLLRACERCYKSADITGGVQRRDGASVTTTADGEIILAFRGTLVDNDLRSFFDWLQDFHAELVTADGLPGKVHRGFLDSLNSVWSEVFDAIEGIRKPAPPPLPEPSPWWKRLLERITGPQMLTDDAATPPPLPWAKKLYITGHSKGGAVAQLAAVRFAALHPTVVTFAAPMCGDLGWMVGYPDIGNGGTVKLTRFEGKRDIVPWLPPIGYYPVGECISECGIDSSHSRRQRIEKLIAEWEPGAILNAHHLSSGYLPWVETVPPDNEPTSEAA